MSTFAVKYPNQDWRIAEKMRAQVYAEERGLIALSPDWEVWSERRTGEFIGYVGNGERAVDLGSDTIAGRVVIEKSPGMGKTEALTQLPSAIVGSCAIGD